MPETETKNFGNIGEFITSEENAMVLPVEVADGYEWSFREHVKLSTLYKNGKYETGNSPEKPFKNITLPILRLQYHAVDFDVKDILLYIDDTKKYFKSFLVRKKHEKWARENNIDTFIDDLIESYTDYGGVLVKKIKKGVEVVPLQSIAFCDQTDILGGAIGIKHFFSPDDLRDMSNAGWDADKIETAIEQAKNEKKSNDPEKKTARTTGRYVEVYEIHGQFPQFFLTGNEEDTKITRQIHIVAKYNKSGSEKGWLSFFKGKEKELPLKFLSRDKIYGRALGIGGAEELFEPQVWTNYDIIHIKGMLDTASKTIFKTTDKAVANRNKVTDLDNGEIISLKENTDIAQVNTFPTNLTVFDSSIQRWENHAQLVGGAGDALLGKEPPSGTPFKLQELVVRTASSLHSRRRGKIASFLDEIYRDWVIPQLVKELTKEDEFLADVDLKELQEISNNLVQIEMNRFIMDKLFNGEVIFPEELQAKSEEVRTRFMSGGRKRFIKILKDELKDAPIRVKVNIVGKQEYLEQRVDKLVNVFRQILSAPQILENPQMADFFNDIIEASGLEPIDFSGFRFASQEARGEAAGATESLRGLSESLKSETPELTKK